ncbi:hypothetical protein [Longimicrobium sp.]|uniref:hypothetical protein n=1 Tax=Longimicrobium sp. TaxID=2029185 RepID=UPI002ED9BC24
MAAQSTTWIALLRGAEYELRGTTDTAVARIPLQLDTAVRLSDVTLQVVDVRRGARFDENWHRAFSVSPATEGEALLVHADLTAASLPGPYLLTVRATARGQTPIVLQMGLVRPAAVLAAGPLKLQRVRWPGSSTVAGTLQVRETGGLSRADSLRLQGPTLLSPAGGAVNGSLELEAAVPELPAGGNAAVGYRLEGELPLGKSTGTLRIHSPQSAAPLEIPVEVVTRNSLLWLFLSIMVGLIAGWWLRVRAVERIELNRARLPAYDLVERMQAEVNRTMDADFVRAAQPPLDTLQAALKGSDLSALRSAVTGAETALQQAHAGLAVRLGAAQTAVDELARLMSGGWTLPMALAEPLSKMDLAAARASLDVRDAGGALVATRAQRTQLLQALRPPIRAWAGDQHRWLGALASLRLPLPAAVAEPLRTMVSRVLPALPPVDPLPDDITADGLYQLLGSVDAVRAYEARELARVPEWLGQTAAEVIAILRTAPAPDVAALDRLHAAVEDFARHLRDAPSPEDALRAVADPVALGQAFRQAVEAQLAQVNASDQPSIIAQLDQHAYLEAAQATLGAARKAKAERDGSPLGDRQEAGPEHTPAPRSNEAAPLVMTSAAPLVQRIVQPAVAMAVSLDQLRARSKNEIAQDSFARWAVVAAALLAIGYLTFAPTYLGTFRDLFTIFMWAFGLNVTVEAFATESARFKPT